MPRQNPTQFKIKLSTKYSSSEREAIAEDVLEYIRDRSAKGKGPGNKKWPGSYSTSYSKSLDFKIAGKSKNKIDQTLLGDMLTELELVSEDNGEIIIGYSDENDQQGKAEGNILGTYGQSSPIRGKARDFIKLDKDEIEKILKKYPIENKTKRDRSTMSRLKGKEFVKSSGEYTSEREE